MKRLLLPFLFGLVLLAGCAPATVIDDTPAAGVTLTQEVETGYSVFRLVVDPAVTRVVLRFPGAELRTNSADCVATTSALECSLGPVESWYTLAVAGPFKEPPNGLFGVACRGSVCNPVFLTK